MSVNNKTTNLPASRNESSKLKLKRGKIVKIAVMDILIIILLIWILARYVYAASPAVIRNPKAEHYHFRMQILIDGKPENFTKEKYQDAYTNDQCNAKMPDQPIYFDNKNGQLTHIHWEGMTGGMLLKYYGWNYIGGINRALGYRLDDLNNIQRVNTHGNILPRVSNNVKLYVFSGDESYYKERSLDDFINQDLEQFFGVTSNFPAHYQNKNKSSLLDKLYPKIYAHGNINDGDEDLPLPNNRPSINHPSEPPPPIESEQAKLKRINNLIGNIVIFVQENTPSDKEIKYRFSKLESLPDSMCAD